MKDKILIAIMLAGALGWMGCESELKTEPRKIYLWNADKSPVEIFVNGEKAVAFEGFQGELYLNSGEYELTAKSGGTELDKVNITLEAHSDDNYFDNLIFNIGGTRDYALLDVQAAYYDDQEYELTAKFFDQNWITTDVRTSKVFWPGQVLPSSVSATEGYMAIIYQFFPLPEGWEGKSDEEIIDYCVPLIK